MTQHRYFNFGDGASAAVFKEMLAGIVAKGVLSGGEMGLSGTDRVTIAPIWVALESRTTVNGRPVLRNVLVHEDEQQTLIVPITSAAANYSIVYRHSDVDVFGGAAAELTLDSGLLRNENILDGIVIGHVLYPGGGIALASSMLIHAPQMHLKAVSSAGDIDGRFPPTINFTSVHLPSTPVAPAITAVDDSSAKHVWKIDNTAGGLPSHDQLRWTFTAGRDRPRSIFIDYVVETGLVVSLDLEDTDGGVSSLTLGTNVIPAMLIQDFGADLTIETYGTLQVRRRRLRIAHGQFTPGKRFRLQATLQTPAGKTTRIVGVGVSGYDQPFAA